MVVASIAYFANKSNLRPRSKFWPRDDNFSHPNVLQIRNMVLLMTTLALLQQHTSSAPRVHSQPSIDQPQPKTHPNERTCESSDQEKIGNAPTHLCPVRLSTRECKRSGGGPLAFLISCLLTLLALTYAISSGNFHAEPQLRLTHLYLSNLKRSPADDLIYIYRGLGPDLVFRDTIQQLRICFNLQRATPNSKVLGYWGVTISLRVLWLASSTALRPYCDGCGRISAGIPTQCFGLHRTFLHLDTLRPTNPKYPPPHEPELNPARSVFQMHQPGHGYIGKKRGGGKKKPPYLCQQGIATYD